MTSIFRTLLFTVLINSGADEDEKRFYVDVIETGNSAIPLAVQCKSSYLGLNRFLLYHADKKEFILHRELQPLANESYFFVPLKSRFAVISKNGYVRVYSSLNDITAKKKKPEKEFKLFLFPDQGKETYAPKYDSFHTFLPVSSDEIIVAGNNSVGPTDQVVGSISLRKGDWSQRYESFFNYDAFEYPGFEFDGKYLRAVTRMELANLEPYDQVGLAKRILSVDMIQKRIVYDLKWYSLQYRHHAALPKGRLLHVFEENEKLKMSILSKDGFVSQTKVLPNYVHQKENLIQAPSIHISENNSFLCIFDPKDLRMVDINNPKVQKKIQWPFSEECDWEKIEFKYLSVDGSERKRIVFVYENKFAFWDLDLWKVERIDNFPTHDQIFGKD